MAALYTGANFAVLVHHNPEGPTDPSKVKVPSSFVVVIAGASRGIGLGVAQAYATAGASGIVISSRNASDIENASKTLLDINANLKVHHQACDISSEEDVKALFQKTKEIFGRLDVLVIAAGAAPSPDQTREGGLKDWPANITEGKPSELERLWKTNVLGPYTLQHHFLPLLEETTGGAQTIVLLTSVAGFYIKAAHMPTSYSLTKLAATRLSELVHEAHHENGVLTHAVQPGGVMTDMVNSLPEGKNWQSLLIDDVRLAGGFCVWLTKERKEWLSGRYLDARWDVEELLRKKGDIIEKDLLKVRLAC